MYECFNCGMLPDACVCVPWCFKHDRAERCEPCVRERREEDERRAALNTFLLPWYVVLWRLLSGG